MIKLPKARIMPRWTPEKYHRDPCPTPSLSASVAHAIVSQSPLHGYTIHPRLGGIEREATKAMDQGSIIHAMMLGKGAALAVFDVEDFRRAEVREARALAEAAGRIVLKKSDFERLSDIAAKLTNKCAAAGFPLTGKSEVAIKWWDRSPETGEPILCRSMLDHVFLESGLIIDLKKVNSAHPYDCARHFVEYGYDIANAAYSRALGGLRPDLMGRTDFVYLFVEIEPPYSVLPARPDGALREIGRIRWERALTLWERGLTTGAWPDYCEGSPVTLTAPGYVVRDELGELGAEYL
jgi:PDDEXK-like domain of unknown function (DUF3799)